MATPPHSIAKSPVQTLSRFLGWSNSQLKSHSVWLYSEDCRDVDKAPTAAEIRGHAGELQNIRIPAKFASRLGLCFSSTYATCAFRESDICTLPDVMTPRGGMLTDGVGVITTEGLKAVIEALPVSKQKIGHKAGDVSAIQIRIGGCKGVLARWDNLTYAISLHSLISCRHVGMHPPLNVAECRWGFFFEHLLFIGCNFRGLHRKSTRLPNAG